MNTPEEQLHTLIAHLSRDEKRFVHQYLSLWLPQPAERQEMEYLFALYETKLPRHPHRQQAIQLFHILLAALRFYESSELPMNTWLNRLQDVNLLAKMGIAHRCAKLGETLVADARQAGEWVVAAETAHQLFILTGMGLLNKHATPEEVGASCERVWQLLLPLQPPAKKTRPGRRKKK